MGFRIGTDAHLYDDPEDVNIAPLLDSKFDSEKCEALKRLLALIAQGFDVSNFFPRIVGILLNDQSPGVVGAAAAAFASMCLNNFSLIERNYRRLCEILPDVEEWGQIILIGILLCFVIARHGLVEESIMFSLRSTKSGKS
ncbi:ap3-complex subunit beta-a [Quercus suber]|uniref:Ap3-complex subunit beta-a n=1 Tax=Quercus suber TaxID=58331 RepID=A0AAW0KGI4_QUESU